MGAEAKRDDAIQGPDEDPLGLKADPGSAEGDDGCFPARALVTLESGEKVPVSALRSGQRVLCMDEEGHFTYSDFLTYLDRDSAAVREFCVLETQNPPRRLTLTASHLLYVADDLSVPPKDFSPMFASLVQPGKCILIVGAHEPQPARVVSVTTQTDSGAFAPLTSHGTLIVDDVVVSCFAVVQSHHLAKLVFWPLRLYHSVGRLAVQPEGVHWYSRILYSLGKFILPKKVLHSRDILESKLSSAGLKTEELRRGKPTRGTNSSQPHTFYFRQ
ncbi:indian hedgehog protein-like [Lissotriton helveticus]